MLSKGMAQLIVRNLDDDLKELLRRRAALRGHSMEEEVRDILRAAANAEPATEGPRLGTRLAARFRGRGLDEPIAELRGKRLVPMGGD